MERVVRELRSIVFQLRDTGRPVVVQPADTDLRIQELSSRLADLEQTLRRLNGTLEVTTHELDLTRRGNGELKTQLLALAQRLTAAEQRLAAGVALAEAETGINAEAETGATAEARPTAPIMDEGQAFAQARQLMLNGDYYGAERAFADYVTTYPDGPRTPEARYQWGRTLSVRGAHPEAAAAYIGAIRGWPQTAWAPEAVVGLARAMVSMNQPTDACQILVEFVRRYPKVPANVTARATATRAQAQCAA